MEHDAASSVETLGIQLADAPPEGLVFRASSRQARPAFRPPFRPPLLVRMGPHGCSQVDAAGRSSQLEHQLERVVYGAQLVVCQMADSFSQSTRIDGSNHLAKDLRRLVWERHLRMKTGGKRRTRCWADDYCGEGQEIVSLHDHRIAASLL